MIVASSPWRTSRGVIGPVLVAVAVSAAIIVGYVAIFSGDPSALVCLGRAKLGTPPFEAIRIAFPADGFDGQYYYAIARDPWARHDTALDLPAYRHSRIVYPVLAWFVSGGGDPHRLLWALPAVNLVALAVLTWLGAVLARHYGRSPWWGAALPLLLNATTPALRDLTDPVATAAACSVVVASLLAWRAPACALLGIVAILAREQNAAIVAIVALDALRKRDVRKVGAALIALGVGAIWFVGLRIVFGVWPISSVNAEFLGAGIWWRVHHMTGPLGAPDSWLNLPAMALLFVQIGCAVQVASTRSSATARWIAVAGVALALCGGAVIYSDLFSYTRVFWWLPFAVWLAAMERGRWVSVILMTPAAVWPLYALLQAWFKVHAGSITYLL
jgi:hypothetical protein